MTDLMASVILNIIHKLVSFVFGTQEGTSASVYDRIKAAVARFDALDLDGDGKREGVVMEVLGWGVNMAVKDIHLAIQLALKDAELSDAE